MRNTIAAFNIFLKHGNESYPFGCEHTILYVYYDPSKFSKEELTELKKLGFHADHDSEHFYHFV